MSYKNVIFNSLKESFLLIQKNKLLFIFLCILQIIFFTIFSSLTFTYFPKIMNNVNEIVNYLNQQRLDEMSMTSNILQQKDILGEDPLSISRNFNEMLWNFRMYLIYLFIVFIVFISITWSLIHKMIYKNKFKSLIKIFIKIIIVSSIYLGLIFFLFISLINVTLLDLAESTKLLTKLITFLFFSMLLLYFMFISISLLQNVKLRDVVQKTLFIGIKKIHYLFMVYFINIFLLALSIFLLLYSDENIFLLFLSIVLLISTIVLGRIFLVTVVEKLNEKQLS